MLEGEKVLHFWFHACLQSHGQCQNYCLSFTHLLCFSLRGLTVNSDVKGPWQKERSFHIFICQVSWTCLHTYWAHGSSLPWKGSMFYTELKCVAFIVPPPSSVLVLHFSRRTQSRTVRHDTWDHVGMDAPLFPPGFTSFFPSLVRTFSTGSKPTGRLVCVHGVVHKILATEPSASGNRTKGLVYSVPGISSSIPDSHAFSIFTKCST